MIGIDKYFNLTDFTSMVKTSAVEEVSTASALRQTVTEQPETQHRVAEESETSLISDLALILVVAAIATVIFKRLRQPVVLGYIVAGFLVSPHCGFFPTVVGEANINFWAELGIIFLLFSLGLEFSFKKLVNVGGSAAITALVIISGMMTTGFFAGKLMGFSFISSLFLGGMLSMSSTTIILKALSDLNLMHRRFTTQVLAVLIVEDLFAVVMMVLLSSIAINNTVSGNELIFSIAKLVFFLVLWFLIGVYVIPSFLNRQRRVLTDELLLVFSVGLCFLMVICSTYFGFSSALGAFVMGSILAGTSHAERIERVISPVKDLFGAVFFISVGMMVDPQIITHYLSPILTLSLIVIVGMIVFGTIGMLATGQPMRIAIESGFSLTQIGEFSFIIATLGMSLGVIDANLYPIVVAVSVVTTFFTPYFIKLSDPFSRWVERKMPPRLNSLLQGYSKASTRNESELTALWKRIAVRNVWRIMLYSVILVAILYLSHALLFPMLKNAMSEVWANLLGTAITIVAMAPSLLALCYPSVKRWEHEKLQASVHSNVPFIAMRLLRVLIAFGFLVGFVIDVYSHVIAVAFALAIFILITIYFSKSVRKRLRRIETKFINNLNERELRRSGKNNNLVSDMHLAYVNVGYNCPFVGQRLADSNLGSRFGVNVASIQRGSSTIAVPKGDTRIFPGDTLGVIGTDEQIQQLLTIVESNPQTFDDEIEMEFTSIVLPADSPLLGKRIRETNIREHYSAVIVSVERSDGTFVAPAADTVLLCGDNLWLVGDKAKIKQLV